MSLTGALGVASLGCDSVLAGRVDSGNPTDSGPTVDAGPGVDAGPAADAGSTLDAGTEADGGQVDAGADAGAVDAGPTDAGPYSLVELPDGGWGARSCGPSVCNPTQLCVDVPSGVGPPCADAGVCMSGEHLTSNCGGRCPSGCCEPDPHCVDWSPGTCTLSCSAPCGMTLSCMLAPPCTSDVCFSNGGICASVVDGGFVQCENA